MIFTRYNPHPVIEVSFKIDYASPEMLQALSQAVKNGKATLDEVRTILDLNGTSPMLFDSMNIHTQPGHTDVSFRASIRKEF